MSPQHQQAPHGDHDHRGYQTLAVEARINRPTVDVQYSPQGVAERLLVKACDNRSRQLSPAVLFVLPGKIQKAEVWAHTHGQSSILMDVLSLLEPMPNLYIPVNMQAYALRSNPWTQEALQTQYVVQLTCTNGHEYSSLPLHVVNANGVPNFFPDWPIFDATNDPTRPGDDLRKGMYLQMAARRLLSPMVTPSKDADPLAVLAGLCETELSAPGNGAPVVSAAPGLWRSSPHSPSSSSDTSPSGTGGSRSGITIKVRPPNRIKSIHQRVAKRDRAMSVPDTPLLRASPTEEIKKSSGGRKRAFSVGHYSANEASQGGRKRANTASDAGLSDTGSAVSSPMPGRKNSHKGADPSGGFGINPYSKCASCSFLSALRKGHRVYQAHSVRSTWKSLYKLAMCMHAGEKATGKALHRGGCHRSRKDIQSEFELHFCANKYTWHRMPKDGSHPRRLCSRFKPEWELVNEDNSPVETVGASKDAKKVHKPAGVQSRPRKESITTATKNALDKLSLAASSHDQSETPTVAAASTISRMNESSNVVKREQQGLVASS